MPSQMQQPWQQRPTAYSIFAIPTQAYSAADFLVDAKAEMADIVAAGKVPLLVGGSMMYFKVLLEGLSELT